MRCTFVSRSDKNWEDLAGWRSGGGGGGGGGVKTRDLADVSQHGSLQKQNGEKTGKSKCLRSGLMCFTLVKHRAFTKDVETEDHDGLGDNRPCCCIMVLYWAAVLCCIGSGGM